MEINTSLKINRDFKFTIFYLNYLTFCIYLVRKDNWKERTCLLGNRNYRQARGLKFHILPNLENMENSKVMCENGNGLLEKS